MYYIKNEPYLIQIKKIAYAEPVFKRWVIEWRHFGHKKPLMIFRMFSSDAKCDIISTEYDFDKSWGNSSFAALMHECNRCKK